MGGASPLAFDLGDVGVVSPGDYELALTLDTGRRPLLTQFGKAFQNLSHDLLEAERARLVRCLLVGDLPEIARYEAFAELKGAGQPIGGPAEIRLYQSNVAILPLGATGFQWRLADIDKVSFDEVSCAVVLESGSVRLLITRLARRTGEFHERLAQTVAAVAEKSVLALHTIFPFLDPDQLGRVATVMTEGRVARLDALGGVHPQTPRALLEKAVDAKLRPYFDELSRRAASGGIRAGFKLIRQEAETLPADERADASGADALDAPPHSDEAASSANGAGAEEVTPAAGADGERVFSSDSLDAGVAMARALPPSCDARHRAARRVSC